MTVVSNAGPLIALARIGKTELLPCLFGEVVIPEAVQTEVARSGKDRPGTKRFSDAAWLRVEPVSEPTAVRLLRDTLDAGESEAIVLALECEDALLLMDEAPGRRVANARGLSLSGTLGILILAKERGKVDQVAPLLHRLVDNGFHISEVLYRSVLEQAGEA